MNLMILNILFSILNKIIKRYVNSHSAWKFVVNQIDYIW